MIAISTIHARDISSEKMVGICIERENAYENRNE